MRLPAPPLPQIEADEEAKKALDWVREMYAFSVAAALEHVQLDVQVNWQRRPACQQDDLQLKADLQLKCTRARCPPLHSPTPLQRPLRSLPCLPAELRSGASLLLASPLRSCRRMR